LIGRKRHLEALADAFGALRQGRTVVVHVHGPSGVGKSALVRSFLDSLLEREIKRLVMALLDSPDRLAAHARDLLHIEPKSLETAVRELLLSGDSWLAVCAIATAAELKLRGLATDIAKAGDHAGQETVAVARAAAASLA